MAPASPLVPSLFVVYMERDGSGEICRESHGIYPYWFYVCLHNTFCSIISNS